MELDGNALAGDLAEVFAVEMTTARFTCAGCRHADAVATLRVWTRAPGVVARCPSCGDVVLSLVRTPARVVLTLTGTARLELPV
ncbi:hypothetical protein Acy02nite_39790 [Actinoplanes cyaneus]|uniref:Uncharacterized protein n=1 Tax=Actinoplanes cyaneus TaxID=52696 RepID=A0A919M6B7_9ACTN|nr:DUF6510 family protein [Actinoplanes cyaneus]MCW2139565.1 hypothetical protein [Actinoplanes cyaneus]GID66098.1 hypothetical protein Acy02nite_39790 [Actinoplanes cyaneus]